MKTLFKTLSFIYKILSKHYRTKGVIVSILLLFNSGLELLGLSAILPLLAILLENDVTEKYAWVKWLMNSFGLNSENDLIILLAVGLFLVFLIKNAVSLWIVYRQSRFSSSLFKDLMLRMHKFYYRKGFKFFKDTNSNEVMRDVKGATERFTGTVIQSTISLVNEIFILSGVVLGMLYFNYKIILLLILTVAPISFFFYKWVRKRSLELSLIALKNDPIIYRYIFESIFGFVDVIISGTEKIFREKISKKAQVVVDINIKSNLYNNAPARVIETSLMLAIALIISFGIYFLPSKLDLLKILGVFVIAGYKIIPSVSKLMIAVNGINQSQWVFPILEPLLNKNEEKEIIDRNINFKEKLSMDNVSFSYADNNDYIIKDCSIKIQKGEVIGIIGPSGSGKTTLMNIFLGFLKPTKGDFKLDDEIINESVLKSFYKKVGYVQQQVYLIDGTIADNIAFGIEKENLDLTKINEVIMQASLTSMIDELPDGIHTYIGENGTMLSGGQRQRVGIARALYFNAEILFFDEATSALDSETEKEITEAIQKLSNGELTIIIIAHRATTLKNTDRILRIEKGQEIAELRYNDIKEN
jgi:ABC-type multidrug transport system fused ATPase/permease subunit